MQRWSTGQADLGGCVQEPGGLHSLFFLGITAAAGPVKAPKKNKKKTRWPWDGAWCSVSMAARLDLVLLM